MPYREADPSDPTLLVGVELPGGPAAMEEMARAFAEEFAALGFDEERLLRLFRRPGYVAAHGAYRALGEERIRTIVRESCELWGRFAVVVHEARAPVAERPGRSSRLVALRRPSRNGETEEE